MEAYSTQALPLARKLSFWNEISSATFAPLEVIPADAAQFEGRLRYQNFGAMTLAEVHSSPGVVQHTPRHVAQTRRPGHVLLMPLSGGVEVAVGQRPGVLLGIGDCCLVDHASVYHLTHRGFSRTFCIGFDSGLLAQLVPDPPSASGRIIRSTDAGMPALTMAMLQALWQQWQQGQLPDAPLPAAQLVGCIAASLMMHEAVDVSASRLSLIKAFIDAQLHEPALGPAMIAAHAGISGRYLRLLWSGQFDSQREVSESISAYICRRRLELCAQRLADPTWRQHSITDIALRFGFGSSTQFGCAFRKQFGLTPREYRRHAQVRALLN